MRCEVYQMISLAVDNQMAKCKHKPRPSEQLFPDSQRDLFEKAYAEQLEEQKNQPVECLGMTFENDEKRREYFLEKLREKCSQAL